MQTVHLGPESPASQVTGGDQVRLELGERPQRYYHHGWQSWSLAAWHDASRPLPTQKPYMVLPQTVDPLYAFHPRPHGSWVGAVELADGQIVLLGSLGVDAHVELDGQALVGTYESGSGAWYIARGQEMAVFSGYAAELGKSLGQRSNKRAGGVWCSWYSLYTDIDEELLARVLHGLADLPFGVFQVDDGWQEAVGDWEPNAKFPSGMKALADGIRASGRTAGLWLAPLIAVESSQLFRSHSDWFLRDGSGRLVPAGFNWGRKMFALDTTRPAVADWLASLMKQVRAWGFDYIKLDFLFAGALPGSLQSGLPREAAYREALQLMRDAMGEDAYFLACGAPIVPSLGIPDALRIGPDVWSAWESLRDANLLHNYSIPGTRNAIRTTMNRLWLKPLVACDPDVAYFRSIECTLTPDQKKLLQSLALICDFRATSDLPQWLSIEEREHLRQFLTVQPVIERLGPRAFRIDDAELDYSTAMELAHSSGMLNAVASAVLGWLADRPWALRLNDLLTERASARRQRMLKSGAG